MKKLFLSFIVLTLIFVLASCYEGVIEIDTTIDADTGAGTRVMLCKVYKDSALRPDDGNLVGDNSEYLFGSYDDVIAKLQEVCALDDAVIEMGQGTDDYDVIMITYSWDDIEEYNTKSATIAGERSIEPAVLEDNGDGSFTFVEPGSNLIDVSWWAKEAIFNDPELYDPKGGDPNNSHPAGLSTFAVVHTVTLTVGDTTEEFNFLTGEEDQYGNPIPPAEVLVTGVFDEEPETPIDETPVDETPVDETPVDETPVDETPVDETPVDETPVDEDPTDEDPTDEDPTDEDPTDEDPKDEDPKDKDPKDKDPKDQKPPKTFDGGVTASMIAMLLAGAATAYTKKKGLK